MPAAPFVSTGSLPPRERVVDAIDAAWARFRDHAEGELSTVYPALAAADPSAFGVTVASVTGDTHSCGDCSQPFTLMSVAKPFVLALVCEANGVDRTRDQIGVNATGLPFNSLEAVPADPHGRTNPMVNPGAIATTSRIPGESLEAQWEHLLDGLSRFAGRELGLDAAVFESSRTSNHRNRELAAQLAERDGLATSAEGAVELYTRQSSIAASTHDLAAMGATLAAGGRNTATGEQVVSPRVARHVLSAMATAGMYERSGDWLWDVGLPGKSGISGCIVTIAPGKGALATWSPPLDSAGNSVRGTLVAEQLAVELGLDIFAVPTGT